MECFYKQQLISSDPKSEVEVNASNAISHGLPVILNMPAEVAQKTDSLSKLIKAGNIDCVKTLPDGSLKCNFQECTRTAGRPSDMSRHLVNKHYDGFSQYAWICPCCGPKVWFATSHLAKEHLRLPCPNLESWIALKQHGSPEADDYLSTEFKSGWPYWTSRAFLKNKYKSPSTKHNSGRSGRNQKHSISGVTPATIRAGAPLERPGVSGSAKRMRTDNDILANENESDDVTFGDGDTVDDLVVQLLQSRRG